MRQSQRDVSFTENVSFEQSNTKTQSSSQKGGNHQKQEQMQLVNDVRDWLDYQRTAIRPLMGLDKNERINGVLQAIVEINNSFRDTGSTELSHFPHSPTAKDAPSLEGVMPSLSREARTFQISIQAQKEHTSIAGLNLLNLFGGQNTATTASSKSPPTPKAAIPKSAPKTTKGGGGMDRIQGISNKVGAISLRMPKGAQKYQLAKHGDPKSITLILKHCKEMGIRSPDQVAYVLSTAWTESKMGQWMTESAWLPEKTAERKGEQRYGPNGAFGKTARDYGNTNPGDGSKYMGRGFVQLTWKNNYRKMSQLLIKNGFQYSQGGVRYGNGKNGTQPIDLVKNYRHVNKNKDLAARILVLGMDGGHYANSGGLDSYIPENKPATQGNFENARRIVNGSDKKKHIADNAQIIAKVLRAGNAWVNVFNK
ncbi:MAG: hypothetical protein CL916_09720 [Deltaproteobacteria bacterium]|nr:hypothetical protein [Deltaproteobacteria bacterium]